MTEQVLNLGAGNYILEGAVNHDLTKHRPEIDIAHDLNARPWPWEDGSFDRIHAQSVFEHLEINLVQAMDECWRILKPGAQLHFKGPHWAHDNAYADPTHLWRYSPRSFDLFDPSTKLGGHLSFYTTRKWKIVKGPWMNRERSSIHIILQAVK